MHLSDVNTSSKPEFVFNTQRNKLKITSLQKNYRSLERFQYTNCECSKECLSPYLSKVRLATEEGIDPFRATLLIGIMSVGSTLGRLIFGKVADHPRVNRLYLYQISFLMIGISNTLCPVLTSYTGLVIYSTVFGFFEGCYVLLAPVLTGDIVGRDKMAHGVGVLFALKSVPLTLGPPIAGK